MISTGANLSPVRHKLNGTIAKTVENEGISLNNPAENIEDRILIIRGQKVMIDADLAELYGVETKQLNRQVKRNLERFPIEFMFQLTLEEKNELVPNWHRFNRLKHSTALPYVFTEHGVAMLSSVLNSDQAIKMSILIIKTFVKLRELIGHNTAIAQKISQIEEKLGSHDESISLLFGAIQQLLEPKQTEREPIGYKINN